MQDDKSINKIKKLSIPTKIEINNYFYSLKDHLANSKFSFRCMDRKYCKYTIHIIEQELINYSINNFYQIEILKTIKDHNLN